MPPVAASSVPPPPAVSPWPTTPEAAPKTGRPIAFATSDFAMQARRTLAQTVPRVAVQAQAEVAHVLWAAANAHDPRQERDVVDYAQAIWVRDGAITYSQGNEPAAARRLNDEAMQAYRVRRNVAEAFDLSLKAFGANPGDPEIAGNLAFLHLRLSPAQPETARQLALHAIAVRGSRFRTGRLEDWNTYALASAMTGREADARNAMYVTVALAGSVDRNCKAGLERDRPLRRPRTGTRRGDAVSDLHAGTRDRIARTARGRLRGRSACVGNDPRLGRLLHAQPAGRFLEACVVDLPHHAVEIDRLLDPLEAPGERRVRLQGSGLVERPDLLAVVWWRATRGA